MLRIDKMVLSNLEEDLLMESQFSELCLSGQDPWCEEPGCFLRAAVDLS